ncbi:MAG TPA: phosphotransferase [Candidatus Eisenbacteria bacterium]
MAAKDSRLDLSDADRIWRRFEPPLMPGPGLLDRLLARGCPGARARHIDFLDRGVVNSNYRVDLEPTDSGPTTVRLRLSRSAEATAREAALADRLPDGTPRCLVTEACDAPEPHVASLWTWLEGRTLEEHPNDSAGLGDDLADFLLPVHATTFPGYGRLTPGLDVANAPGFHRPSARWLDDLAHRVAVRLENPAHGLAPDMTLALRTAAARVMAPLWSRPPAPGSLVHGDLSPGNIIIAPDGCAVGLLDWEMARAADPAVDAASIDFELADRWPLLAARALERLAAGSPDEWERRLDLARLPLLIDARMVARVRHSAPLLERVDARLDSLVSRWSG